MCRLLVRVDSSSPRRESRCRFSACALFPETTIEYSAIEKRIEVTYNSVPEKAANAILNQLDKVEELVGLPIGNLLSSVDWR